MGPLLKALSHALTDIIKIVYPTNFHRHDVNGTFRYLHAYLRKKATDLVMHNDDLSGFFTSIPHARILAALDHAIARYVICQPVSYTHLTLPTIYSV